MMNYNDGDDNRNEDGNNDDNAASGSGSNRNIFDPMTKPWSCGGGLVNGGDIATSAAQYISTLLKMRNKLLHAKFGVFDWCRCHKKNHQFH